MTKQDDFFIGWSENIPSTDRRLFIGSGLALLATTGVVGGAIASQQNGGGTGTWDQGENLEWRGRITNTPYPLLRTMDTDGKERTAILACMGKCAVKLEIDALQDQEVIVRGSAIRRGPHLMIATQDRGEWIRAATQEDGPPLNLGFPQVKTLDEVELKGMILDTKCWFGAMRPGEGKVHKACASLCIRGGLPPAFYIRSLRGQSRLMLMVDANGSALGESILPYVADPMHISGKVYEQEDLLFLHAPLSRMTRV